MGTDPERSEKKGRRRGRPPKTPQEIENRLIMLAYLEAERQIEEGSASPTTINHFLKLGSTRDQLEKTKLEAETKLALKKVEVLESNKLAEELADKAIQAFKRYSGSGDD
ncbi:MAG: hypothetical protein DI610_01670 [Staphylococcus hominis]|nr:MAG: hypothetical protein DI610_01670 [Staphylococcus hominis]